MPRPSAQIQDVACAGVAPKAAAAWKTMTTELVKPTSTATKPATSDDGEKSFNAPMRPRIRAGKLEKPDPARPAYSCNLP